MEDFGLSIAFLSVVVLIRSTDWNKILFSVTKWWTNG
jgi:hypothetical protein